jgi:hypothetical protein
VVRVPLVARSLLLASSRREAIEIATATFEERGTDHHQPPESADAKSIEEYLIKPDIVFGSADDVVEALSRDAAVVRSTN